MITWIPAGQHKHGDCLFGTSLHGNASIEVRGKNAHLTLAGKVPNEPDTYYMMGTLVVTPEGYRSGNTFMRNPTANVIETAKILAEVQIG